MRDATNTKKRAGITFLLEVDPAEIKNHRKLTMSTRRSKNHFI